MSELEAFFGPKVTHVLPPDRLVHGATFINAKNPKAIVVEYGRGRTKLLGASESQAVFSALNQGWMPPRRTGAKNGPVVLTQRAS
jgi:hypothetical protein